MGRGRQKAKATKVARKLKYFSPETDYKALERELVSASSGSEPDDEIDYEELGRGRQVAPPSEGRRNASAGPSSRLRTRTSRPSGGHPCHSRRLFTPEPKHLCRIDPGQGGAALIRFSRTGPVGCE